MNDQKRAALAQQDEPDLSRCPQCNGPADNGFDRSIPPSPYLCTKCMAEPVTEDMKSAVRWAPSSAYWSQRLRELFGPDAREGIDALERRLAEAQQAEPVEPVAKVELMMTGGNAGLATRIVEIEDHLRERLRPGPLLYTSTPPPQRKLVPLTEEEILKAIGWERAEMYMKLTPNFPVDEAKQETLKNARAVERAVWEKNHG